MKYVTPEISWHSRDPLYSVDLQYSCGQLRRLATCGTDKVIRVCWWMMSVLVYFIW